MASVMTEAAAGNGRGNGGCSRGSIHLEAVVDATTKKAAAEKATSEAVVGVAEVDGKAAEVVVLEAAVEPVVCDTGQGKL